MKKALIIIGLAIGVALSSSCEEVVDTLTTSNTDTTDIAGGLKKALEVGTDTAVSRLNVADGYFKDQAVKILLPDQLETAIATFKAKSINLPALLGGGTITGETLYNTGLTKTNPITGATLIDIQPLKSKEDDLILGINRAAEAAASDAKPIFVDAITNMSIADANSILFGTDSAATEYLETNTRSGLFTNFDPKIESALQTVKVGDQSVSTRYENFVSDYNDVLNKSVPGVGSVASLMNIQTITTTDLSEHATDKALDGLFLKVQEQEGKIRTNPLARVTDLLKDVFGKLDE